MHDADAKQRSSRARRIGNALFLVFFGAYFAFSLGVLAMSVVVVVMPFFQGAVPAETMLFVIIWVLILLSIVALVRSLQSRSRVLDLPSGYEPSR